MDTDADLSSRYGLDLEAREAVNEKFQETTAAIDARLAEEYSAKLGPDTRKLMEEHERHLEEVGRRTSCSWGLSGGFDPV